MRRVESCQDVCKTCETTTRSVFTPAKRKTNAVSITSPKGTAKLEIRPRVSGNDFFFVREAIIAGAGVGPLPWFVARDEIAAGRVVRVLPDHRSNVGKERDTVTIL